MAPQADTEPNLAVRIPGFNLEHPYEALEVVQSETPTPGQGEVLVRISLRPVNPADLFSIMGVYPGFCPQEDGGFPAVPGLEGVGTVVSNGPGASKFAPGQRVVGMPFSSVEHGSGTWQQLMTVREEGLYAAPEGLSDEAAAQAWINPITVYGMLEVLAVPPGGWLVQTAAGSVLGREMIQLAKHRGIKTVNVVRRAELVDELKALGADEVVVSTAGEGLAERVAELTGGKGACAAVECVGGRMFEKVVSCVRSGGTAIIYGAMSGLTASFSIPDPLFRCVDIKGFWLIPWTDSLPSEERDRVCREVLRLLADGVMTPYTGKRFLLEQAAEAVKLTKSAARGGKYLLEG